MKKRLIGIFLTMSMLLSLFLVSAFAADEVASGTCGDPEVNGGADVTWVLDSDGVLTISGTGAMADWTSSDSVPWHDNSLSIQTVVIENGVTSVGDCAFEDCTSLTSISIPNSVTSIGNAAFCSSGLTSVTIPSNVTSIGNDAFDDCDLLTSVTIPDGVTSIGQYAFYNCDTLAAINVSSGNLYYKDIDGVLLSADGTILYAYPKGKSTTSYTIPNSVLSIEDSAFGKCGILVSVTIPDNVTSIKSFAFSYCSSLTEVTIGNGVTSIEDNVFYSCEALTSVTIPNSVTSIGGGAFRSCTSLTNVMIPNSISVIGSYAFADCTSLTNVDIPDSVDRIWHHLFDGCTALTSVTIPSSVTSIGQAVFASTTALTDVYYGGTQAQWTSATTSNENIGLADTVTVHYNCTDAVLHYIENATLYASLKIGDVYVDGVIDNKDQLFVSRAVSGDETLTDLEQILADVNGDGVVDAGDTEQISQYLTSIITSFSAPEIVASGVCGVDEDNLAWVLNANNIFTVCGKGDMANAWSQPWASYNSQVVSVVLKNGVTSIGGGAFSGFTSLTSVTIPNTVTDMGSMAFQGCTSLEYVLLPESLVNFNGEFFFNECTLLQTAGYKNGGYDIEFAWKNAIPAHVFSGCKTLTNIAIPSGTTSIGEWAFSECESLTNVGIPSSVTSIGETAFFKCEGLTNVRIPSSVTSIGEDAFADTTALTDVYFGGTETQWTSATTSNENIGLASTVTVHYNSLAGGSAGGGGGGGSASSGTQFYVGSKSSASNVYGTIKTADASAGTVTIDDVKLTYAGGFSGVKLGKNVEGSYVNISLDKTGAIEGYFIYEYGTITAYKFKEDPFVYVNGKKYTYSDSLSEKDWIRGGIDAYCYLYLDGNGEIISWEYYDSQNYVEPVIEAVWESGFTWQGKDYSYADNFSGDKLTSDTVGCDASIETDSAGAVTRIVDVWDSGYVAATDSDSVTLDRYGTERTYGYADTFSGVKLDENDINEWVSMCDLNARSEITDYSIEVSGEATSTDNNGITFSLDGGESVTYAYSSSFYGTKPTNTLIAIANEIWVTLNSKRQIVNLGWSNVYGNIASADPDSRTVSIVLEKEQTVKSFGYEADFDGSFVSPAYVGYMISAGLDANGQIWNYGIDLDYTTKANLQKLPDAVKFVPYSTSLLDIVKDVYNENAEITYPVLPDLPAWLEFDPETGELSGIPTETGSCAFSVRTRGAMGVSQTDLVWTFILTVKDNTTTAVTQETATELTIKETISNMTTSNLSDQTFTIEDKVEDQDQSNFEKFTEVYLDGVKLVGGKIGENETVKTVADVPDEWEYYAEEGSTKITVRAQTFEKKGAGTHTIAATFVKTDPQTGEQTTMTAAQNFTISTPHNAGGSSRSTPQTPKSETKDNGTIQFTVKDGTAQLDAKSMDKLTESAKNDSVLTLDFTTAGQTVTTVKLPAGMIGQLAKLLADDANKAESLVVKLTSGTLNFDAASLAEIAEQAGSAEVSLSLTEVAVSSLPAQMQESLTKIAAEKVFSVEIKAGDKQITGFGGGRVTFSVPFTVPAERDARGYAVWHLKEDGGTTRHSTSCADGALSFRTAHFSYYAVAYQEVKIFTDIDDTAWYASDVNHMASLGLMNGVGGSSFAPDMQLNRAQIAQILYNLEKGEPGEPAAFEDVSENEWYTDAVNWAAKMGIVDGVGNGKYEPMRAVTRGELVAMLYKYAAYKKYYIANAAALDRFSDSADLPSWGKDAMQGAVGTKLINGIDGKLAAKETATRAQAAKVLTYFLEMYEK